jgi:hypothetical protein
LNGRARKKTASRIYSRPETVHQSWPLPGFGINGEPQRAKSFVPARSLSLVPVSG